LSRSYFPSVQYEVPLPLPQKPNTRPCLEPHVFSPHCLYLFEQSNSKEFGEWSSFCKKWPYINLELPHRK